MKIAITGHRPNKLGNDYDLTSPLIKKIKDRILIIIMNNSSPTQLDNKEITLISGMALGIDTLFAKIAIENNIPFIAAIPCVEQYKMWPDESIDRYFDIVNHPLCTQHYCTDSVYNTTCMQIRNEWMVDNCDILIAVWDGSSGGTANCVKYAESKNKQIIYINPKEL